MVTKVNSIEKILEDLNTGKASKPWQEVPGLYTLSQATVAGNEIKIEPSSMALKVFVNIETAELKSYVAKWLDIPETNTLL